MNNVNNNRRNFLKGSVTGASLLALGGAGALLTPSITYAASLTKAERDAMTPDDVIAAMKKGNERYINNKPLKHDYIAQRKINKDGQYPSAVILSCIDSRVPVEIVLDAGIGNVFSTRVAGSVSNADILGSMEFACQLAGSKVVLVLGHTKCGAVRGAVANAKLGNLTGLVDKIKPAIAKTTYLGKREAGNYDFVDAVAKTNVMLTLEEIRANSPTLVKLEKEGTIKLVGAMYDITTGKVEFMS